MDRYHEDLYTFKKGAFNLSVTSNAPVIPMRICYRVRPGKNRKPKMTLIVGKPIYPDFTLLKKDAVAKIAYESRVAMEEINEEFKKKCAKK